MPPAGKKAQCKGVTELEQGRGIGWSPAWPQSCSGEQAPQGPGWRGLELNEQPVMDHNHKKKIQWILIWYYLQLKIPKDGPCIVKTN